MPGGWIDRKEDPVDCAPREIREELSLEVALEGLVMVRLTQRRARHLDFAYRCRPVGEVGELSSELLSYAWFDLDETPPLVTFQQLVVNKLREERDATNLRSDNHE
jgi:ADP-ribose pyrophosphatase YjhB (NUDIX family)